MMYISRNNVIMRKYTWVLLVLGLFIMVGSAWAVKPVYPQAMWDLKQPDEVGMDAGKLKAMSDYIGGRGCVVRHGYMVYTWGDVSRRGDVASACKPWYSHFLFKALEDGKIPSLDEKAIRWEPRLKGINKKLGYKDRNITWRHLANQTSCYGVQEAPGTAYDYNDWQMALFWDTLFLKVYGATYKNVDTKVLRLLLTDILQCQDKPTLMAFGIKNRPGRVGVSVRDFARFGLLYLRGGNWKGKQLISPKYAKMAVTSSLPNSIPRSASLKKGQEAELIAGQRSIGSKRIPDNQADHFGSYSWLWWTNGVNRKGKRNWPDVPVNTYGAFGHGGLRAMIVLPSLDLIISWNDTKIRGRKKENEALKLLVESATSGKQELNRKNTKKLGYLGRYTKWAKVEISLIGPTARGKGKPNPFNIVIDINFISPSGREYNVPGFYDGNGRGGMDGMIWKVRFSADELGKWSFNSTSSNEKLNGYEGTFTVTATDKDASGFYRWGRLECVGTAENKIRYLKFREGPYWLKAGCDDPENFLGRYKNYNTLAKRKAAVDYLSDKGINSMYIMTHNLDGDDKDVWPWLGDTAEAAKKNGGNNSRFDISRLDKWRELFEYMQVKGVVPYLVLEDDSAWKGYDHKRYYREMIARFGYLPVLIFNFNEEYNENYSLRQALEYMKLLKKIDPFDHPRGIHNVNKPNKEYADAVEVDFTSIQAGSPGTRRGPRQCDGT